MAEKGKTPGLFLRNAGIFNPILVQAVGLCPVIAMAVTFKGAALLAAIAAITITLCEFIASAFLKVIPRWIRISLYILLGCAIVCPVMYYIEKINPQLFGTLGIYMPVMAVNSLIVLRCERFAVNLKPFAALADGATAAFGYGAVLLIVGAMREILGSGSIMGYKFWDGRTLTGLLLPFGGFLMLGFIAAALRTLIAAFWPDYLDRKQPKPQKDNPLPVLAEPSVNEAILEELTEEDDSAALREIELAADFDLAEITEMIRSEQTQTITVLTPRTAEPADRAEPTEPEVTEIAEIQDAQVTSVEEPETSVTEEITATEITKTETATAQLAVEETKETSDTDPVTEVKETPVRTSAADEIKIEFRELTLEDVINDTDEPAPEQPSAKNPEPEKETTSAVRPSVKPISFDDTDDELEALMNRSLDDIIGKKEDTK